jgi:hypothetical protein
VGRCALVLAAVTACSFQHGAAPGSGSGDAGPRDAPIIDTPTIDSTSPGNGFRKAITVQRNMVAGDVTDFPVWIDLTSDADLAAHARPDHSDVYFTDVTGAPIPYEITGWSSQTGKLQAWVRSAHLTPSMMTPDPNVTYVRFGGPTAPMASNGAAVFDNSFKAVWHLDDTTGADSTGTAPGTLAGVPPAAGMGQLGSALVFSDVTSAITFTNPLTGGGPSTMSAWVNETPKGAGVYSYAIVIIGTANQNDARWFYSLFGGGGDSIAGGLYLDDDTPNGKVVPTGTWHKLDWVLDGGNVSHLYIDAAQADMKQLGTPTTAASTGVIANAPTPITDWAGPNGTMAFAGSLDEVRIANTDRSLNWLKIEYANQHKPSTFYMVGMLEAL